MDQRLSRCDALLHAAGELRNVAVREHLQPQLTQNLATAKPKAIRTHPIERAVEAQQFIRWPVIEGDVLRQKADSSARLRVAKGFAQQLPSAGRGAHEPERQVDSGCLPCPIRPEETEHFATLE